MVEESRFRLLFWTVFWGMIAIQAWFAARARQAREGRASSQRAIGREEWGYVAIRTVRAVCLAAFLVLYAIGARWLQVLSIPLPGWLRWTGGGLGVASLAL